MSAKGEKYSSPKAMKKHESTEGKKDRMKEYGKAAAKKAPAKAPAKKFAFKMKKGM